MRHDNVVPFDPARRGGLARRGAPDKAGESRAGPRDGVPRLRVRASARGVVARGSRRGALRPVRSEIALAPARSRTRARLGLDRPLVPPSCGRRPDCEGLPLAAGLAGRPTGRGVSRILSQKSPASRASLERLHVGPALRHVDVGVGVLEEREADAARRRPRPGKKPSAAMRSRSGGSRRGPHLRSSASVAPARPARSALAAARTRAASPGVARRRQAEIAPTRCRKIATGRSSSSSVTIRT